MTGQDALDEIALAGGRPALWRVVFATMAAPAAILRRHAGALPAPLALGVSTVAFALFFAQTGIDLHRGQTWDTAALASLGVLAGAGAVLGSLGLALLATIAWLLLRPFASDTGLGWDYSNLRRTLAPGETSSPYDIARGVDEKILNSHARGGEPLIRFRSDRPITTSWYTGGSRA